jgi:glycosyltransferase involved in cell wall biosynthesis
MIRRQLRRYHRVVYSAFARDWLRRRWGVDAVVIHPAVELGGEEATPKARVILAVGRFLGRASDQWNNKRQDVLIDAFAQLPEEVRVQWRLVLAGGVAPSPEMDAYLEGLRAKAKGLDVTLEVNVAPERLQALLGMARLFWHASGFDRPPSAPERAEHFGISTAEAMSHRVIPLVFADGGQVEIVEPHCGRLWRSVAELVDQTTNLARATDRQLDDLGAAARAASLRFGRDRFDREVRELIEQIGASRVRGRIARALRSRWRRLRSRAYGSGTGR